MPETMEHGQAGHRRPGKTPAHERLTSHVKLLVLAVLVILGTTVSTYVGTYMTTYAMVTLHLNPTLALSAPLVGGLSTFGFSLAGGWLSDRFGRRPVMLLPRLLLAVITWPMFLLLSAHPNVVTLLAASIVLTALTAMSGSAALVVVPELLPRAIRATGLAVAYAVGVSLFGGTTQLVITSLIEATGDPTSPGWYVTATSIVTLAAMWALPESRDKQWLG